MRLPAEDRVQVIRPPSPTPPPSSGSSSGEEDEPGTGFNASQDETIPITLMRYRHRIFGHFTPQPDAWGFPFHEACWDILTKTYSSRPLDIQATFEVCQSFPVLLDGIHFGHSYGGIKRLEYGYDRCLLSDEGLMAEFRTSSSSTWLWRNLHPFQIDLQMLFSHDRQWPNHLTKDVYTSTQDTSNMEGDIFFKLPVEILQMIPVMLSSQDVLHLKQASRAMATLALTQEFWKSRFLPPREFSFIIEAKEHFSSLKLPWKLVYLSTKSIQAYPFLVNRKRLWKLATDLRYLIDTRAASSCLGTPYKWIQEPRAEADDLNWITGIRCEAPTSVIYERIMNIPSGTITAVYVSLVDVFGRNYVSGIRIETDTPETAVLGYIHPKTEQRIDIETDAARGTQLLGFDLALDERAIRGLRVLCMYRLPTRWVGDYRKIPLRRLVRSSKYNCEVESFRVGFDVSQYTPHPSTIFLSNFHS